MSYTHRSMTIRQTSLTPVKSIKQKSFVKAQQSISAKKIDIYKELNQKEIEEQDKDIEIERLQTTCKTLNTYVTINQDLKNTIEFLQKQLNEYQNQAQSSSDEKQELITQYQNTIDLQKKQIDDLLNENKNLKNDIKELISMKQILHQELQNSTDHIIQMEEKVYKSNKISLEILKHLKEAEEEVQNIQFKEKSLRSTLANAVYIPVKDDIIDRALAEYINNYPEREKLQVLFMRESEGVYQFGNKKISVKVEKDSIKIRVGGGFLSIDEFLDQYTGCEADKLERLDPVRKISERLAVRKAIANSARKETSFSRNFHNSSSHLLSKK